MKEKKQNVGAGFRSVFSKVDFPKLEKELLRSWQKEGILNKYLQRNKKSNNKFSFLDGPITANNPMGVHHAWGRTYKDLWQRFFNMRGYKQRFQNGFDEQGLWVEVEVEKELGLKNKKDIENLIKGDKFRSLEKFINLCKERVKKFSSIQTEQSIRLGYFMDWENSYHTSSDQNNYSIWNFIKKIHENGWLYKGRDSVPWCPRCGTAISQHEILTEEYKELTHESVYFKLPIKDRQNEFLLVWTTTPWTIPANVAVAINSKEKYVAIFGEGNEKLWVMKKRVAIFDDLKKPKEPLEEKLGGELIDWEYDAPFDDIPLVRKALEKYTHRVIDGGETVTETEGTGLLHVAPGAGEEDFKLGLKNKLPVIAPIEEDASYVSEMGEFVGKNAKVHPELIIDYLKRKDSGKFLLMTQRYKHRYPTCWRCKTELVWRVVDEWYIAMDKPSSAKRKAQSAKLSGKTFRKQMMEVAMKINWMPKWGLDRELDWLKNMHDWLISKKRYWGLALPIWECKKCGDFQVIGSKEDLKEKAIEGWEKFKDHSPHRPWIDHVKLKCEKCGKLISRIPDVGNPWLDAGIVPFSTLPKDWFPADFITESFPGQFKNWFYSLIAMSTVLKNTNSFETVLGFASVRDEKGEEMHKSKGNAIEFNSAADEIGVDVMRWVYARQDPETNLNFGYGYANDVKRRFHLILWNCYKFFIDHANLHGWKCEVVNSELKILDKWILARLTEVVLSVNTSLEKYDAMSSSRDIEEFVLNDFSTWYIRRSRERVNTYSDEEDRNVCLSVMYGTLVTLSKILAPFIPFTAEGIHRNLTGDESVHLQDYPKGDKGLLNKKLVSDMEIVRKLIVFGHAKRKELGIKVRQPLRKLEVRSKKLEVSMEFVPLIRDELNVKQVEFTKGRGELSVEFDTNITQELRDEGLARDIVRKIQEERKKLGTKLDEKVNVFLDSWPKDFEEEIKKKGLINELKRGADFRVDRV